MTFSAPTTSLTRAAAILSCAALASAALTGCRGDRSDKPPRQFFPDLDDQQKWKPQTDSTFFADRRTMRKPPANTVAFGRASFVSEEPWADHWIQERKDLLKADAGYYEGRGTDGLYLARMPVAVDAKLIELGKLKYSIYCVACHGYTGDGKGMIGTQWSYALPNYHDAKYKSPDPNDAKAEFWKDGYIFHVARVGVIDPSGLQKMPGYAHALSEGDAWAVVSYIRVLQESQSGLLQDVPESERQVLERSRATAQAAQQPPSSTGTAAPAATTTPATTSLPAAPAPKVEHGKTDGGKNP